MGGPMTCDKQKSTGRVYVVQGFVEFEGGEVLAVTTSKKLAQLAIDSDKAIRKAAGRYPFDFYSKTAFALDTAVYRDCFSTSKKVRVL
jgi:hypothetical protein